MARTNKKQARVMKAKSSRIVRSKVEIPKINSLDHGLELGVVTKRTNPLGRTYHWYELGRGNCYETGVKCDKDGYRYLRRFGSFVITPMSGWIRSKLRK